MQKFRIIGNVLLGEKKTQEREKEKITVLIVTIAFGGAAHTLCSDQCMCQLTQLIPTDFVGSTGWAAIAYASLSSRPV